MSKIAEGLGDVAEGLGDEVGSFMKVLKDFNVIGFALGVLMANSGADLANSFIDGIIMPTLQPFLDKVQTKNATIKVGNISINLEKFIQAFIKFLALALVVYMLLKFGVEMSRPVQWVSVRSVAPGASL